MIKIGGIFIKTQSKVYPGALVFEISEIGNVGLKTR